MTCVHAHGRKRFDGKPSLAMPFNASASALVTNVTAYAGADSRVDAAAVITYIAARNQFSVCLATLPFYGAQPASPKLDDRPRDTRVIG